MLSQKELVIAESKLVSTFIALKILSPQCSHI